MIFKTGHVVRFISKPLNLWAFAVTYLFKRRSNEHYIGALNYDSRIHARTRESTRLHVASRPVAVASIA